MSAQENAFPQTYSQGSVGTFGAGYWAAGSAPSASISNSSAVDRLDFANDTAKTLARGPLSRSTTEIAATSSTSHGYFAGGAAPSAVSLVDRSDYRNDLSLIQI